MTLLITFSGIICSCKGFWFLLGGGTAKQMLEIFVFYLDFLCAIKNTLFVIKMVENVYVIQNWITFFFLFKSNHFTIFNYPLTLRNIIYHFSLLTTKKLLNYLPYLHAYTGNQSKTKNIWIELRFFLYIRGLLFLCTLF